MVGKELKRLVVISTVIGNDFKKKRCLMVSLFQLENDGFFSLLLY